MFGCESHGDMVKDWYALSTFAPVLFIDGSWMWNQLLCGCLVDKGSSWISWEFCICCVSPGFVVVVTTVDCMMFLSHPSMSASVTLNVWI